MTNSKNYCLIIYTSSMTLFGANDYAISQTKRFGTLIPLDVLPKNKKRMGEIHESAVFFWDGFGYEKPLFFHILEVY